MLRRSLTITLQRPASVTNGHPVTYEVAVIPLAHPSSSDGDATLVSSTQTRDVTIGTEPVAVTFELVPTDEPSLSERLPYRLAYREKYQGRVFARDFVMPDFDVHFDDLHDLGNLLGGETYLLQSDLGKPGRVAKLNDLGQVVDADNIPVGDLQAAAVQGDLNAYKVAQQQEAAALRAYFLAFANQQVGSIYQTLTTRVSELTTAFTNADTLERANRINAVAAVNTALQEAETELNALIATLDERADAHDATLAVKADLVGGKVPSAQLPSIALGQAVAADSLADLLELTAEQVQPGDMGVTPDGTYILNGADPADPDNWVLLSSAAQVDSVNGQTGAVVLSAADVGAIAANAMLPQSQITNLVGDLAAKASVASLTAAVNRIAAIEDDTTIVKTTGGLIAKALMPADTAFITTSDLVAKKDGTVLNLTGGGTLDIEDVGGLTEALAGKVDTTDPALTDDRTPLAHAATHAAGEDDAITPAAIGARATSDDVDPADVTGLSAILTNNGLTASSDHDNRIASLENFSLNEMQSVTVDATAGTFTLEFDTQVSAAINYNASAQDIATALQALPNIGPAGVEVSFDTDHFVVEFTGPLSVTDVPALIADDTNLTGTVEVAVIQNGGGSSGGAAKASWWNAAANVTGVSDLADFAASVAVRGPFSKNGSGQYAYYKDGVAPGGDTYLWPYITPNGHLELREWDETADPDPQMATQAALDATDATVATKADQSALDATDAVVATKADQSAHDALSDVVETKAAQAALDVTNAAVATKAEQSALATEVTNRTNADNALDGRLDTVEAALPNKADLTNGTVPVNQIPTGIPAANITGIEATLTNKADLVTGRVPNTQMSNTLPISYVANLQSTLDVKADLVGGKIPSAQIPSIALASVTVVANRAAMLSLSNVQPGDVVIISATDDQGTYLLAADDPSVFGNWVRAVAPPDVVSSVNGQIGTVVLDAAAVGARSSAAQVPMSEVAGLVTALSGKVDVSTYTTGIAGKTSPDDVKALMSASVANKQLVDYVSTSNILSRSGQQSIDGTLVPVGSRVLLAGQSSSVQNGVFQVNSSAWTRPTDFASGDYLLKGTEVKIASGQTNANTIWLMTANSGVIDTNANNWTKVLQAGGPIVYTADQGVQKIGTNFRLNPKAGGGIIQDSTGAYLDPNVAARKFAVDIPAGATIASVTHNLGTTDVQVEVYDKASGTTVLVAPVRTGPNTVSVEFATAPSAGQYRLVCIG